MENPKVKSKVSLIKRSCKGDPYDIVWDFLEKKGKWGPLQIFLLLKIIGAALAALPPPFYNPGWYYYLIITVLVLWLGWQSDH